MDIFSPDIGFASPTNGSSVLVTQNLPGTTIGSTANYVYDAKGVARNPQSQQLASSLGLGAVAPYEGGVALGSYANALAKGCTALGYHALAKVYSAIAVGDQAQALTYRAIAIGKNTNATGTNSISIGAFSQSSFSNSIAMGNAALVSAADAIAIGTGAIASGVDSITIGVAGAATGSGSISIGEACRAVGNRSLAIGQSALSFYDTTVAIGPFSQVIQSNSFACGAAGFGISDVWFGQGPRVGLDGGTIAAWTLHGEEAGGGPSGDGLHNLNKVGGALNLAGGRGTGSAAGGAVNIQVSGTGAGAETLNALVTRLSVTATQITGSIPRLVISNGASSSSIILNNNAGFLREIQGQTAGVQRWSMRLGSNDAESGGDAGSRFELAAYSDAGAFIDFPIVIPRVAGGHITFNRQVDIFGNLSVTGGITCNPSLQINSASEANLIFNVPAGQNRSIRSYTTNSLRWYMNLGDSSAESGSNAGSNFALYAYSDAGAFLDAVFHVYRQAGAQLTFYRPAVMNSNLGVIGNLSVTNNNPNLQLFGQSGGNRGVASYVSGASRWWMQLGNATAETGGDAGSDFQLLAYNDAGAQIDAPIGVVRKAGGTIFLQRPVSIGGSLTVSGTINISPPQTTRPGSSGGDLTVTDMTGAPTYKSVMIRVRAFAGTAFYNFLNAFVATPMSIQSAPGFITALSNVSVTISSAGGSDGWVKLEGF